MLSRASHLGFSCLIVLTLLLFGGSAGAQDVSPRCHAEMDRAAGHYAKCLLKADASYRLNDDARKEAIRKTRCGTRFDRRTSRAIRRNGEDQCPSSVLVAALEERTADYVKSVKLAEADGTLGASILWVQDGTGGTLSDTTLTLTEVNRRTGWIADRPDRYAGQVDTGNFVSNWTEGEDSFATNPPNADFTCVVGGVIKNYVVELSAPHMIPTGAGHDLSYAVTAVGEPPLPETTVTCEYDSHLFIDSSVGDSCTMLVSGCEIDGAICTAAAVICIGSLGAVAPACLTAITSCAPLIACFGSAEGALGRSGTPNSCLCDSTSWLALRPLCESTPQAESFGMVSLCRACGDAFSDYGDGANCDHDNQCHSEQCAWRDVSDEHEKCIRCDSEVYLGADYSTCMEKGYRCHTDGMCKSGDCDDGWTGLGEGHCK